MALDVAAVVAALLGAYLLRFDGAIPEPYWGLLAWVCPAIVAVRVALLAHAGLYHRVWAYASLSELVAIVKAMVVGSVIIVGANLAFRPSIVPRSVLAIEFVLSTGAIGAIRLLMRVRARDSKRRVNGKSGTSASEEKRILIIGAGDAGAMAVREIQTSTPWTIVGLIDDDPGKHGQSLYGIQVLGGRERIPQVVRALDVTEILIAIPSASRHVVRELVDLCRSTGAEVRILPALYELIDGRVTVNHIREVRIEDLLGREPLKVDMSSIAAYLAGRRVLVTGAGGSIGSELCRQIARYAPEELILMGHGENSIFEIDLELAKAYPALKRRLVIGDIRDALKVRRLFEACRPHVVFHAAAHKHVPLMEGNPDEAATNNVFGTLNLLSSSMAVEVERFILISTDKAVEPQSAMGASKRVAEMLLQAAAAGQLGEVVYWVSQPGRGVISASYQGIRGQDASGLADKNHQACTPSVLLSGSVEAAPAAEVDRRFPDTDLSTLGTTHAVAGNALRYVAVRFGNVLGSRGSVVQVFKRQIAEGGPVTVTDPEMRRYFMTTSEAVQLVIQAGALGEGGEVFVLDMGEPVRILDLVEDMIRLSGFQPGTDIQIHVVGPRPGEKTFETLIGADERAERTSHPKILRVHTAPVDAKTLGQALGMLREAVDEGYSPDRLKALLLAVARSELPPTHADLAR